MLTEREKFWNVGSVVIAVVGVLVSLAGNVLLDGWPAAVVSTVGMVLSLGGMVLALVIGRRLRRRIRGMR